MLKSILGAVLMGVVGVAMAAQQVYSVDDSVDFTQVLESVLDIRLNGLDDKETIVLIKDTQVKELASSSNKRLLDQVKSSGIKVFACESDVISEGMKGKVPSWVFLVPELKKNDKGEVEAAKNTYKGYKQFSRACNH